MLISQTTLTGAVRTPAGAVAKLKSVTFTLNGSDSEAGITVTQNRVAAEIDAEAGTFQVTLWPNDAGFNGTTTYSVAFEFDDGSSIPVIGSIFVRYSPSPKTMEDIAFEVKAGALLRGWTAVVMKQSEYAALAVKAPLTAYFLKAG